MENRVLIIDDEREVLDVMSEMLGTMGFKVTTLTQGSQALELMKKAKYDLVITDLIMPEMGGLDFVKKLRRSVKDIPVIIIAGVDLENSKINFKKYGIDDFIRKPFFIEEIEQKLLKYLDWSHPERPVRQPSTAVTVGH